MKGRYLIMKKKESARMTFLKAMIKVKGGKKK